MEYNEAFIKQANKPKPILFLPLSGIKIYLFSVIDQIKIIITLENMLLAQRCSLLDQVSGEENPDGCLLGCQGLLLRQWGDMSHCRMSHVGGHHSYSRLM